MKKKPTDKVKTIMTSSPVTVNEVTPVSEVSHILSRSKFSHLPVVRNNMVVGIISTSDLLASAFFDSAKDRNLDSKALTAYLDQNYKLTDIMTKNVACIKDHDTVRDAAKIFENENYHCLPVVDAKDEVVGILTTSDLARFIRQL